MMKKVFKFVAVTVVLLMVFTLASCSSAYKKGVKYKEYPERDVPIYDDAVVFSYEVKGDKCKIKYGSEDDVDDIMEFYQDEFEDEDYRIFDEDIDDDEYSVEGIIDDITFEIDVEEARGDKEEKFFDTIVEVEVIFDSDDYEEDEENDEDEDESAKTVEEETLQQTEGEPLPAGNADIPEEGGVKVQAISDILEGQIHTSTEGLITVEFGTIEVESGSNDYLHMECPLTITNNSDNTIYIAIEDIWTNGLSVGRADNFELAKGESGVLYADLGASTYKIANIREIKDLFFYLLIRDTYNYEVIDTLEASVTNPESSYVQQSISDLPLIVDADEVTMSYGGSYSNEKLFFMVFYIQNINPSLDVRDNYVAFLNNLTINETLIDGGGFYDRTCGDAPVVFYMTFSNNEYGALLQDESTIKLNAVLELVDYNNNHIKYAIDDIELDLTNLSTATDIQPEQTADEPVEENTSEEMLEYNELVKDALELIDEYGATTYSKRIELNSVTGEYDSLSEYETDVLCMSAIIMGAFSAPDDTLNTYAVEYLMDNDVVDQECVDSNYKKYNAWYTENYSDE